MLEPVGFWSYTRDDDQHSDGQLSQLRAAVGKAIALQCGAEAKLWQDTVAIDVGSDWAASIEEAVRKTTFFIPIVTPRYLKSSNCFAEFNAFRKRMISLGRNDLIFPVQYVRVDGLQAEDTVFGDDLAELRRHQWIDFTPLLYADARSPEVKKWAGNLAASILKALRRPDPPNPPNGSGRSAAASPRTLETSDAPNSDGAGAPGRSDRQAADVTSKIEPTPKSPLRLLSLGALAVLVVCGLAFAVFMSRSPIPSLPPNAEQRSSSANSGVNQPKPTAAAQKTPEAASSTPEPESKTTVMDIPAEEAYKKGKEALSAKDYPEALSWFHKAADQGHAGAQTDIGALYGYGWGVPQDYAQAMSWYRKAAEQGYAGAQNNIGVLYESGLGVPQDYTQAVTWFRKAADQGLASAQNDLGRAYYNSWGVTEDYAQAMFWWRKAADQGYADAQNNVGWLYDGGYGVNADPAQALTWSLKAANQGHAEAALNIGALYEQGSGVKKNVGVAKSWYLKAAALGNDDAKAALKRLTR
jgi:TPR repeat protein